MPLGDNTDYLELDLNLSVAGKWRPRRSIIFGSWGAEEFGLIGSAEYTEVICNESKIRHNTEQFVNVIKTMYVLKEEKTVFLYR